MAITTPNLGLRVWNLTTDPYDHTQLASNWAKVDEHDHSAGKGKKIPTGGIEDGAITAVKIAPGVVPTSLSINDGDVTTSKIADGNVTLAKLASNSVDSSKIVNASIATADLADDSVTNTKIADNAVDTAQINAGAVDTAELHSGAVTADKTDASFADILGYDSGVITRRGFTEVTADDTTAATTYQNLGDEVLNVNVPANGLVFIVYRALFKIAGATSGHDGKVALFFDTDQVKEWTSENFGALSSYEDALAATGTKYGTIDTATTTAAHFNVQASSSVDTDPPPVTPITWGGWRPMIVEVPTGTFDISVQFKCNATSGGTLHVKERRLWVWTAGF